MVRERIVNDETLTIYEGVFIYCDVSELTVNIYVQIPTGSKEQSRVRNF